MGMRLNRNWTVRLTVGALLIVVCLLSILLVVALHWTISVRRAQAIADDYSVGLADRVAHGKVPRKIRNAHPWASITVEYPPRSGRYEGRSEAVKVHVSSYWRSPVPFIPLEREITVSSTGAMLRRDEADAAWLLRVE